jgi:hypothetical protein
MLACPAPAWLTRCTTHQHCFSLAVATSLACPRVFHSPRREWYKQPHAHTHTQPLWPSALSHQCMSIVVRRWLALRRRQPVAQRVWAAPHRHSALEAPCRQECWLCVQWWDLGRVWLAGAAAEVTTLTVRCCSHRDPLSLCNTIFISLLIAQLSELQQLRRSPALF